MAVTAKLLKLFLLEVLLGASGAVGGAMIGKMVGRTVVGAVIGGLIMVVVAGFAACRLDCVNRRERFWVIGGGIAGFVVATLVALATISTPGGPVSASILIGLGAVFGAILGRSPHGELEP